MTEVDEILARLDEKPTLARVMSAVRELDALPADGFEEKAVAIVRNFTIEPIESALKLAAYRTGIRLSLSYSGYEPMSPETFAVVEGADVVIVAVRVQELVDELTSATVGGAVDHVVSLARAIRERSGAALLVHNFAMPTTSLADTQDPAGRVNLVRRANVELSSQVREIDGAHLIDVDLVLAQVGLRAAMDERGARVGDAPLSNVALRALAEAEMRHIRALGGPAAKCVVVDADNTLWGGVVGEDGVGGIDLSGRHLDLQRTLLDLRRRGIVLAIASKNEESDLLEVLRSHPDCLVSEEDFAVMRVDWADKASNIEAIANEINLGLEHLVFVDDNPVECDWVRQRLPEVRVVQWPAEIDELGLFDSLVITDEDRRRTEMYRAESKRRAARDERTSIDDYLRSLEMVAVVGVAGPERVARLVQLTQRTNQFNLTTRRHDAAAIEQMMADADTHVISLELTDRFGSNGVIGCGIVRRQGEEALIDTLLMSCRVIGRGAEQVLVNRLAISARDLGASELVGEFVPSTRNSQVADIYPRLGFKGPEDGPWRWPLADGVPPIPDWFLVVELEETAA
jgi:FkbH-like protein